MIMATRIIDDQFDTSVVDINEPIDYEFYENTKSEKSSKSKQNEITENSSVQTFQTNDETLATEQNELNRRKQSNISESPQTYESDFSDNDNTLSENELEILDKNTTHHDSTENTKQINSTSNDINKDKINDQSVNIVSINKSSDSTTTTSSSSISSSSIKIGNDSNTTNLTKAKYRIPINSPIRNESECLSKDSYETKINESKIVNSCPTNTHSHKINSQKSLKCANKTNKNDSGSQGDNNDDDTYDRDDENEYDSVYNVNERCKNGNDYQCNKIKQNDEKCTKEIKYINVSQIAKALKTFDENLIHMNIRPPWRDPNSKPLPSDRTTSFYNLYEEFMKQKNNKTNLIRERNYLNSDPVIHRLYHTTLNRFRQNEKIQLENFALAKRLQKIRPTTGMTREEQLKDYKRYFITPTAINNNYYNKIINSRPWTANITYSKRKNHSAYRSNEDSNENLSQKCKSSGSIRVCSAHSTGSYRSYTNSFIHSTTASATASTTSTTNTINSNEKNTNPMINNRKKYSMNVQNYNHDLSSTERKSKINNYNQNMHNTNQSQSSNIDLHSSSLTSSSSSSLSSSVGSLLTTKEQELSNSNENNKTHSSKKSRVTKSSSITSCLSSQININ